MKINQCPFCKTSDHVSCVCVGSNLPPHGSPHQVRCTSIMCDDVKGPAKYSKIEAIRAWNEASYNPEVEKLKLALKEIQQIELFCMEPHTNDLDGSITNYIGCLNDMIDEGLEIVGKALKGKTDA